jgi:predicted amino acid dehydrogenase
LSAASDFALLGHPSDYQHLSEILLRSRPGYGRDRLERYERTISTMVEWAPSYVSASDLVAPVAEGGERSGILVVCPFLPSGLTTPAGVAKAYAKVVGGCRMARDHGARIIGLGGFTSIVAGQGERLRREVDIALTSGNTLTAALALEQIDGLIARLGWDLSQRTVAIVGATGDIGRACALVLGPRAGRLVLVGRSVTRLDALAQDLGPALSITTSHDVADTLAANLIIAATSSADPLLDEAHLRPGTVVCDVSYPKTVRRSAPPRDDVLVFAGGIAELPFELQISYLTRLPGASLVHGCYAETIALSMAGRDESFSIGQGRISPERITEIRALACDAGIGPAPLLWGQHILSEAEVDSFARLASAPGEDAA